MKKNPYSGKFIPHLSQKENWYYSIGGKRLFKRTKGAGFIAFEGLDGSGQSTQANLLCNWLNQKSRTHLTKEPTNNIIGGLIRGQLTSDWKTKPECLQLLFAADRAHHLEKEIVPLLEKGITVITDRYAFSTMAYGASEIEDRNWLVEINKPFLLPDLTFLIKVSPKVCLERITKNRFHLELFEKEQSLMKVWQNYEELSKQFKNIYIIDGEGSVEEIFEEVKKLVRLKLNLKGI